MFVCKFACLSLQLCMHVSKCTLVPGAKLCVCACVCVAIGGGRGQLQCESWRGERGKALDSHR